MDILKPRKSWDAKFKHLDRAFRYAKGVTIHDEDATVSDMSLMQRGWIAGYEAALRDVRKAIKKGGSK
jgi:hypothetical protein